MVSVEKFKQAPEIDIYAMKEDIKRLSMGRNDLTVMYPYLFTEDHLWLKPTGDGNFYCGVTPFWYTVHGSAYLLFDPMEVPHWVVSYPHGETLMDARDYGLYVDKLNESMEEWRKTPHQIISDMINRPRFISNI